MKSISRIFLGLACITISLGILIVILAYAIGGGKDYIYKNTNYTSNVNNTSETNNRYELNAYAEDVTSIDFELSYGKVTIETGDEFHVRIDNMPEEGYKSYVKNGTWFIKEDMNRDNVIRIFDWNIPIGDIGFGFGENDVKSSSITITIPEDFHGKDLNIDLGAGSLNADKLSADTVKLTVGAGSMEVESLNATNLIEIENGAGNLIIHDLNALDVEVDCGVGDIKINGNIGRDCNVQTGIGNVFLDIEGDEENYNYTVDCGIGHVIINDKSYNGITDTTIRNNNSIGTFRLECGIGKIELHVR